MGVVFFLVPDEGAQKWGLIVLSYIVSVTLQTWEEKQFYIGEAKYPLVLGLAKRMRDTEGGIRAIIRSIHSSDEIEFWYKCGLRGLPIQPPTKHAPSYNLGLKTAKMKG